VSTGWHDGGGPSPFPTFPDSTVVPLTAAISSRTLVPDNQELAGAVGGFVPLTGHGTGVFTV